MHPFHPRGLQRRNTVWCTAVSAFIALGVLACDEEEALTAPPHIEAQAVAITPTSIPDATAMGTIPLPVNQTFNGAGLAFGITQNGAGPSGLFRINNATNTAVALLGQTSGRGIAVRGLATNPAGRAGVFENTSFTGNGEALFAKSNTNGAALHAVANGFGMAGKFEGVRNSGSNTLYVSALGTGNAISAVHTGLGQAGSFVNTNTANEVPAIYVETKGTGPAARFYTRPNNGYSAVEAITEGSGWAGTFNGSANNSNGVFIHTFGPIGLQVAAGRSVFKGDVTIEGTLSKPAGSFRIDHPLDPEHKYLSHSFVESPDMLNVYDGTTMLDGRGEAVVMLPNYFEALNRDFRYQLTAVGVPGPNLHVSQEIRNNRFVIAGGVPGAKVSWLVTGVRQDAYAEAHRIQVETDKPAAERAVALAH
jgi:hypothetical protein